MIRKIISIGLFLASSVCSGVSSAAEVIEIKNTDSPGYVDLRSVEAKFIPMEGMLQSQRFDGFELNGKNIEVIVASIAAPYSGIAENFTKETLKMRGVDLLSRTEVEINGRRGVLVKAIHPDAGTKWGKWLLIVDNGSATLVVNGVFLSGDTDAAVGLERMLKSVIPYGAPASDRGDLEERMIHVDPVTSEPTIVSSSVSEQGAQ